jgi:biotin carboxyl carrier protein
MSPSLNRRRLTLKLKGRTYQIEIEDLDRSPLEVRVDGETYQVELVDETVEESQVPSAHRAAAAAKPARTVRPARSPSKPAYSSQEIRSPMPGNILDIAVAAGDKVSIGQPLCSLEAMKMKSAIRSPREGVIAAVHIVEGQVVVHADLLFTFE